MGMTTPIWVTVLTVVLGSSVVGTVLNRIFAVNDKKKDKQQEILDEIKGVKSDLKEHKDEEMRYRADQARTRILRFSDELRRGVKHSEESFNQVLDDIDGYETFCDSHADVYVNSKADAAIRNIRDVHDKCVRGQLQFL